MTKKEFLTTMQAIMPFEPTAGQKEAILCFANYFAGKTSQALMILKGYAGTGKTTLISALVKFFKQIDIEIVLLAPTGRAAKVLSNYAQCPAYTIHKEIYKVKDTVRGLALVRNKNKHQNTIFFVDEASMIYDNLSSQTSIFSQHSLLDDLFSYVTDGKNCHLVFIGDMAQLPPIGLEFSPALDGDFLKNCYSRQIFETELTEVMRQEYQSGILWHATQIRNAMKYQQFGEYKFDNQNFDDVIMLSSAEMFEELQNAYQQYGGNGVVFITKSNKQANWFNQGIRSRILFMENELDVGDFVMNVKNNYFWLPNNASTLFIANGDIMEVLAIRNMEERYGFHFADVTLKLVDYDMESIDVKVILDTLTSEEASLSIEQSRLLYEAIYENYSYLPTSKEIRKAIKNDEYYNALQIKFSYVQTCHKTQGGQWEKVFILLWNNVEQMQTITYYRWLYTAVTRASKQLYIIHQ